MGVKFANNAATTLAAGISSGATSFQVASATGFPSLGGSDYMYLTVDSEVVKVTATSGTTFTCDATSSSHSSGDTIELRMSAELLDDFAEDTEALPLSGGQMSGNITMAGSQTVDGRDLSADGTKLDGIAASANNYVHPNHSGDVTSSADGATTIANNAVTTAKIIDDAVTADKLANAINTAIAANTAKTGITTSQASAITANTAKTTNATHTGDVTGATALTIGNDKVVTAMILDANVTTAKIADDAVTADKLANSINTDIATGVTANTTANAALPKAGGTMTGNLVMGTNLVDGIDISARDAVLTSTTTTANAALPKAGGTLTGTVTVSANAVGTVTTDNDGSFAMSATNNFKCTPAGNFTLTFTSIVAQSGNILLVNSGGHTVAAHANTKVDANLLATVSTAGTYLLAYFSDGTNVYMTNSAIYT